MFVSFFLGDGVGGGKSLVALFKRLSLCGGFMLAVFAMVGEIVDGRVLIKRGGREERS